MKDSLIALAALAAAVVAAAEDLQAAGAIRPDHQTKWGAFRVSLDQLHEAAQTAETAADEGAPVLPDAAALGKLGDQVETMALTLDHLSDQVAALVSAKA